MDKRSRPRRCSSAPNRSAEALFDEAAGVVCGSTAAQINGAP